MSALARLQKVFALCGQPGRVVPAGLAQRVAAARPNYAGQGVAAVDDMLSLPVADALVAYYQALLAEGGMERGDRQSDRYRRLGDPAAHLVHLALKEHVQALVGEPIKPSYNYVALYCPGASLPLHTDRPQCRHTLSLLIDAQPHPADGIAPWPIEVFCRPGQPPVVLRQSLGGGVAFRGHEIPHQRHALPDGHQHWVLLLHYVAADYDGPMA